MNQQPQIGNKDIARDLTTLNEEDTMVDIARHTPSIEENGENSTDGLYVSQDSVAELDGEVPGNIFQDNTLDFGKNISMMSTMHKDFSAEDTAGATSDISKGLDNLLNFRDEGDSSSSDDELYGDESDLLSVASTMQNVSTMSMLKTPVLPAFPTPLSEFYWCEPCAKSFRVRGGQYTIDRKKIPSEQSVFRLITVDLCEVAKPIRTGFCAHPRERVQQAIRREKEKKTKDDMPPFIFCVNIMIPGPPFYHFVFYYAVDDMSQIKQPVEGQETEHHSFNTVASKFFFGSSDKFRDSTFKLVPRIVSGNIIVRKAVGSKPTIIGKKLTQSYVRDERFLEVMVDIGSSLIASKVVKLAKGYAKNIVVDMGFLLEGKSLSCLPERMMGTVRLTNVDFKSSLRFVDTP